MSIEWCQAIALTLALLAAGIALLWLRQSRQGRRRDEAMLKSDEELMDAFETFLNALLEALRGAAIPNPPRRLREIAAGALVGKILRLSDSVLALCRGRHGHETGLLLRTLILAYANLKFIANHDNPEGAALRFMRQIHHVRDRLEEHLVRPDVPGEGFPVQSAEAWAADEKDMDERWKLIEAYVAEDQVVEMTPTRPPDRSGKAQKPLEWSWTGMSERELFEAINDLDAYRWYVWFSNEVHSNVVGVGDLITQVNEGRIDINDEVDFTRGPIALAGKYTVLSLEAYDALLGLGIAAAIEQASDTFSAAIRSN